MFHWYRDWVRERYRDPATGRYVRRVGPTMLLYIVLMIVIGPALESHRMQGIALWGLAVLPALPIAAVFWILGRYFVEMSDDYQRMLEVRKALIATGITMSLASIWGFLEIYAQAPHITMFYVPVTWFAALGVGNVVNAIVERHGAQ